MLWRIEQRAGPGRTVGGDDVIVFMLPRLARRTLVPRHSWAHPRPFPCPRLVLTPSISCTLLSFPLFCFLSLSLSLSLFPSPSRWEPDTSPPSQAGTGRVVVRGPPGDVLAPVLYFVQCPTCRKEAAAQVTGHKSQDHKSQVTWKIV